MLGRSIKGAGQKYGRGAVEAGAWEEQGRRRAGAGKEQEKSKVRVVQIPKFTQIVIRLRACSRWRLLS